jgi:hypothetical protein
MASLVMATREGTESQDRARALYRYAFHLAIVFALYFGVGKVGLAVPFTSSNVSPIWPAAGIAVAAVLIWGIEVAPAIAFAAFLVNFLTPIPMLASVAIGLGNVCSTAVAGYLLIHFFDFQISLPRLRDVLRLVALAAVLATIRLGQNSNANCNELEMKIPDDDRAVHAGDRKMGCQQLSDARSGFHLQSHWCQ